MNASLACPSRFDTSAVPACAWSSPAAIGSTASGCDARTAGSTAHGRRDVFASTVLATGGSFPEVRTPALHRLRDRTRGSVAHLDCYLRSAFSRTRSGRETLQSDCAAPLHTGHRASAECAVDRDFVEGFLEDGELLIVELRNEQFRDSAQVDWHGLGQAGLRRRRSTRPRRHVHLYRRRREGRDLCEPVGRHGGSWPTVR